MEENETPQVVTPVVETESHLTAPLVDHAGKIAHIEERQAQHEEKLLSSIAALEEKLSRAGEEERKVLLERIASLETRLEEVASREVATPVAELPEEAGVEMVVPEVQPTPKPPEKQRGGRRFKRREQRADRRAS